jgi:hypothetical protein
MTHFSDAVSFQVHHIVVNVMCIPNISDWAVSSLSLLRVSKLGRINFFNLNITKVLKQMIGPLAITPR